MRLSRAMLNLAVCGAIVHPTICFSQVPQCFEQPGIGIDLYDNVDQIAVLRNPSGRDTVMMKDEFGSGVTVAFDEEGNQIKRCIVGSIGYCDHELASFTSVANGVRTTTGIILDQGREASFAAVGYPGAWMMRRRSDGSFEAPTLLLGTDDPRLPPEIQYPASSFRSIASADVNRDGLEDLLIGAGKGDLETGRIAVITLLNNGSGGFSDPITSMRLPLSTWWPWQIEVADFNRDHIQDVVLVQNGAALGYGDGNGSFDLAGGQVIELPQDLDIIRLVKAADIDGDQQSDLIVLASGGTYDEYHSAVLSHLNTAAGLVPTQRLEFPGRYHIEDVAAGAVTRERVNDILVSGSNSDPANPAGFYILKNTGSGTLEMSVLNLSGPQGYSPGVEGILVAQMTRMEPQVVTMKEDYRVTVHPNTCAFTPPECPGDISGDERVGQQDLGMILAFLLSGPAGDLDGDGETNQSDLGIVIGNYGLICEEGGLAPAEPQGGGLQGPLAPNRPATIAPVLESPQQKGAKKIKKQKSKKAKRSAAKKHRRGRR